MSATDAATVAAVERALHTGVCGESAEACCWTEDEIIPCTENDLLRLAGHVAAALLATPPIAQALAAVEAVARVEALAEHWATDPHSLLGIRNAAECVAHDLRAALRPGAE